VLRSLSDRELRDMGLMRSQIGTALLWLPRIGGSSIHTLGRRHECAQSFAQRSKGSNH
jgi:hypothetical protein